MNMFAETMDTSMCATDGTRSYPTICVIGITASISITISAYSDTVVTTLTVAVTADNFFSAR